MRRIGILYHPLKDTACSVASEIAGFVRDRGLAAWLCSAFDWERAGQQIEHTDLILSVGGDGTILRAAQIVVPAPIPIVGINVGRLGFMTELSVAETKEKLPLILDGSGRLDERSLLEAELDTAGAGGARRYRALNDIVVARGATVRLVNIEAAIDGEPLTSYRADGVVVATATGCTGYSLAAGGPILHPQSPDFVLAPIAPHLSFGQALVLPPTSVCRLTLGQPTPGALSVDGLVKIDLACGDRVTIRHSASTVRFLRVHDRPFYGSLEERLRGKTP